MNNEDSAYSALENLRKRLLDLTGRNRLLNFRHSKGSSLRVIDELPNQLVETLLSEKEMRFKFVPEPIKAELINLGYIQTDQESLQEIRLKKNPTAAEWAKELGFQTSYEMQHESISDVTNNCTDRGIQTLMFPYELEARLRGLHQKAKTAIEETGANILYLALGYLEWFDNTESENGRIAPLFLIPVKLQKGKLNKVAGTYEYELRYSGEDIIPNLSLREKLRVDFALALPDLVDGMDPETYFKEIQGLIRDNQPQWKLRRYITLSLFNFSKLLMYLDLNPDRWPENKRLIDHPVVNLLLNGSSDNNNDEDSAHNFGFGEEYLIDELSDVHGRYPLIEDADSSQHSALIDAVDGNNLVIEGPPGTGKSQTITNIIAAALYKGKKVLFMAEKLAALEVVKRRLDAAQLGNFCLELHSHKSQKRKVLDEIDYRLKKKGNYRKPREIDVDIARYEEIKQVLKEHVEQINSAWKSTGKTLHEIFMSATHCRENLNINPEVLHPEGLDGESFDPVNQRRIRDEIIAFGNHYSAVIAQLEDGSLLQLHPWYGVQNIDLLFFDIDRVVTALEDWQNSLKDLTAFFPELAIGLACQKSEISDVLSDIRIILSELELLPELRGDELLDVLPVLRGEMIISFEKYIALFEDIQEQYSNLPEKIRPLVLGNQSTLDAILSGCEKLNEILKGSIKSGDLAKVIKRLQNLEKFLGTLKKPIAQLRAAIGKEAGQHLEISTNGIRELKSFIFFVKTLPVEYLSFRGDKFDNDELDHVLPRLRNEIDSLWSVKMELEVTFCIDDLPPQSSLLEIRSILETGGIFRWFKKNWRSARKQLKGLAVNEQLNTKELLLSLNKAIEFVGNCQQFSSKEKYKEVLGEHYQGLNTNIIAIETVRKWYQNIRQKYGFGFGSSVSLGNAIIDLPADLIRGIRSLAERGIEKQLEKTLLGLEDLKTVFRKSSDIHMEQCLLLGENGVLEKLLNSLINSSKNCTPLLTDGSITIDQLSKQVKSLVSFRNSVNLFEEANYDNKIFGGRLGLKVGLDFDNEVSLDKAKRILSVAICLDRHIKNHLITSRIYENPEIDTFKTLNTLSVSLRQLIDRQFETYETFKNLVFLNWKEWSSTCGEGIFTLVERNSKALSNRHALEQWIDYIGGRARLLAFGFTRLIDALEKSDIPVEKIELAYKAAVYDKLAREILRELPKLARFSGHTHNALQNRFKEYDEKLKKLQCERIAWQIDQKTVQRGNSRGPVSSYTDYSLIVKECEKKRGHIPLRQLLKRAGEALSSLKPCFMMGPMSVSQYLEPGVINFDLVIIDEASQVKPQDALGAVARGSNLIVVGDPKQLPPTSFFDRIIDDEEEDPTGVEESESILDATLPIFPARRLRWHYRSRHESLIAFSNSYFYDNDLVLFPSPKKKSDEFGIFYNRLKLGCFLNRRNQEEAKEISEKVRDHFRSHKNETLGVVAMSGEQREQIERAVESLAKEDPVFRYALEENQKRDESLFIKNLENVQGDERDVIIISMTYGPQLPGGNVFQRFGPINSDVGWRRLNVLFTRSRKRMHVFSSMGSEDIVVGPTSNRGIQALRGFLSFCETGQIFKTERNSDRLPDSDFEISVADALKREGFECVPQVGVAGFFIDIAVVDPGNPGSYLMGIECDGATYHSAKSVRDRDRLRQKILEGFGWRIRRIWSTDWFKNPRAEVQTILNELHELKTIVTDEIEIESLAVKSNSNSDSYDLNDIIEDQTLVTEFIGLKEKLVRFENEVIRKELPYTPEHERLLRPAMLEALLEYLPTCKSDFLESVPSYLRRATKSSEAKYLESIYKIIDSEIEQNQNYSN